MQTVRRDALPQDGVAQRSDAERGDERDVAGPVVMPGTPDLIEEGLADAVDGALDAAPQLEVAHGLRGLRDRLRRGARRTASCTA